MIKCEKCLYRKNCQFLATHKNTIVEGCTAFESENDLRIAAAKEFAERLKKKAYLNDDLAGLNYMVVDVDDIDNLVKEMEGETDV